MNPIGKALWLIESGRENDLSLADIARFSGVSRFHLSRRFGAATGYSIRRYRRARRLSEAARRLVGGTDTILTVALDSGYGSHEAFTRAFRAQFGCTPETFRTDGTIDTITLVEAIRMDKANFVEIAPPRFEQMGGLLIAGLSARYRFDTNQDIPLQWARFAPYLGSIGGQIGDVTYGVCYNGDGAGNFDYLSGVEVPSFNELPPEFGRLTLAAQRYAVFSHRGHISALRSTIYTIWNKWLPESGQTLAKAPDFERYDHRFDGRTGQGLVEIWLPIRP